MERTALRNNRGMSLIEVLVAMVLLAIVSMAILQSSLIASRQTTTNLLRDEALRVAEENINTMRKYAFTKTFQAPELDAGTKADVTVLRAMRGFTAKYMVTTTVTNIGTDTKQIDVSVRWDYGGTPLSSSQTYTTFRHNVTSIIGRS